MTTTLIYDPVFLNHKTAPCPESPERYQAILNALENDTFLWKTLSKKPPRDAAIEDILRCHDQSLINEIIEACNSGGGYLDADTVVCPESYKIACLAAGAALTATDTIFSGETKNAFSLARPPGHHATPNQAMGFCLFNNAGIAARYAQFKYKIKNVLIIDWDVHHGNGTQDIFYNDPTVFYYSLHQAPFYPETGLADETGIGAGRNTTLNIPLPAFTTAENYRKHFTSGLKTILRTFTPDFIIISAGFDAREGDPLANFMLTKKDYFEMTQEVMQIANQYCGGKLLSVLEGGYLNETLGDTVKQHIAALQGAT